MDQKSQLERRVQQLEERLAALEQRFDTTTMAAAAEAVFEGEPVAQPIGEARAPKPDEHLRRRTAALERFLEGKTPAPAPVATPASPPPAATPLFASPPAMAAPVAAPVTAPQAPAFHMQPPGATFPHMPRSTPAAPAPPYQPAARPVFPYGTPMSPGAHLIQAPTSIPPPLPYEPQRPAPSALKEGHLEQTIGLEVAGWVGALVVVFGAALGVKYAYDAGWIGKVPPELRLLLMALGGFSLIAAGEVVYRKVNRVSAAALFGAGVATLFLVAYAGHGFLDVYSSTVAFGLMAITMLIGSGVAVRGRLVTIAVLSQLAGHLTPLVLGGEVESLMPLLSYLLMLQMVAVSLAWWGGTTRWWTLRWLTLVFTSLWMATILISPRATETLPFVFILLYAGVFLSELIFSAVRPRMSLDATDLGAGVAFALAVTSGLVVSTLVAQQDASKLFRGALIVAYALAYGAAGFAIARAPAASMLSTAMRTLAAALVVIAVPVALAGSSVVLVWGAMAVAFGVVGVRLNLVISRIASATTWTSAVVYLVVALALPKLSPAPEDIFVKIAHVQVPVYVALAWGLSLAGIAVAWLLATYKRRPLAETPVDAPTGADAVEAQAIEKPVWSLGTSPEELVPAGRGMAALATGVGVFASLHGLPADAATVAVIIHAWLLVALDLPAPRLALGLQAMALFVLAAFKWGLVDVLRQRLGDGWTTGQLAYAPVLNPMMALGSLIAISLAGAYWLRRRTINKALDRLGARVETRSATIALAAALILLVTFGFSLEIDRIIERARSAWTLAFEPMQVRLLAFTMLWCVSATGIALIALRLEPDPPRRRKMLAGLSIPAILLTAKFLAFDTLAWHLSNRGVRGNLLLNMELAAAVFVLGMLAFFLVPLLAARRLQRLADPPLPEPAGTMPVVPVLGFAFLFVVLLAVQWEIGRALNLLAVTPLARGVAVSIWWSLFAIATVVAGFITRTAGLRYFGLALFAITLLKVFIIDMQTLDRGWRTVSFIALGLLLLGTSVVYGKYSPKLLGGKDKPE